MLDRDMRGFTLIETLVVVVIISALATMVVLSINVRSSDQGPEAHLIRVAQAIDAVCEKALFQAQVQAIEVSAQGVGWWDRSTSLSQPASMKSLVEWPKAWRVSLRVEGMTAPIAPSSGLDLSSAQLMCGVMGERNAFSLTLNNGDQQATLEMPASARPGHWTVRVDPS